MVQTSTKYDKHFSIFRYLMMLVVFHCYFCFLVESPGSVFYNLNRNDGRQAVLNMLFACLPVVSLLLIWVCIFGVLFWIFDVIPQKAHTKRPWSCICGEIWDSVWWSFVTLATVGWEILMNLHFGSIFIVFHNLFVVLID